MIFTIPNALTVLRMTGSISMFFISPLSSLFYIIYTLCGISDALDGFIARATHCESALGAKLDSIADLLFYAAMLIRLMPILWKRLPTWIWYFVAAILVVRLGAYLTAAAKYHCFASQHTYLNKLTGFSVFLIPFVMKTALLTGYCVLVCIISMLASSEELIIHIRSKVYNPDSKSLFI